MTLGEYLDKMTDRLARAGIEEAGNEARILLMTVADMRAAEVHASLPKELETCFSAPIPDALESAFTRREAREPLAYIVGHAPFYDLEFEVGEGVLIPRFDTEILVETGLMALGVTEMPGVPSEQIPKVETDTWDGTTGTAKGQEPVRILDLCSGSGCVGITIAHELMKRHIAYELTMTDISETAVEYSRRNAAKILGETASWKVCLTDLWPDMPAGSNEDAGAVLLAQEKADLIVSNPPYISMTEMAELEPEVKDHEPALALTDQGDGLSLYTRIVSRLEKHLKPGGVLAVEHGESQCNSVTSIMKSVLSGVTCLKDYGGHDRVSCGKEKEADR